MTDNLCSISYENLRNITALTSKQEDISHLIGLVPACEVIGIDTDQNVRGYFAESEGKKETTVHKSIRNSIASLPEYFHLMHGGVTLVASKAEVKEKEKKIVLTNPSCINGANTSGVFKSLQEDEKLPEDLLVKLEIIILKGKAQFDELVPQISIARNMQNKVEFVSIAGAEGVFDDLKQAIDSSFSGKTLQTSETDVGTSFIPVDEVIRVSFALMPDKVLSMTGMKNRSFSYHQAAKCLTHFGKYYKASVALKNGDLLDGKDSKKTADYAAIYSYFLKIAPDAYRLYLDWREGWAFEGARMKNGVDRDKKSNSIKSVSDGIIFPILGAFSQFVEQDGDNWVINIPEEFQRGGRLVNNLVTALKQVFADSANHQPSTMGRTSKCWDSLHSVIQMAAVALGKVA